MMVDGVKTKTFLFEPDNQGLQHFGGPGLLTRPDAQVRHQDVASANALRTPERVTMDYVPPAKETLLWDMLAAPMPLVDKLFEGGKIITDAHNRAALDLAHAQSVYRHSVIGFTPPELLVN